MDRIVRVDLRWPPKPVISASARDLICQVLLLLMYVCSRVHDTITYSLLLNAFNTWNATNTKLQSKVLAQANVQCAVRDPDWWLINANCILVIYAAPCQGLFSTLAPPESAHTSMDSEQCWFYWSLRKLMTKLLCGVHEAPLESNDLLQWKFRSFNGGLQLWQFQIIMEILPHWHVQGSTRSSILMISS